MLNIYIGKENLPKDKKFIFDVDAFFNTCVLKDDVYTRKVLKQLERAEYIDSKTFKDRFGRGLYLNCLSTGAKILLSTAYYTDYIINGSELGYNGLELLLEIEKGNILLEDKAIQLPYVNKEICVDGIVCEDSNEVTYAIGGVL